MSGSGRGSRLRTTKHKHNRDMHGIVKDTMITAIATLLCLDVVSFAVARTDRSTTELRPTHHKDSDLDLDFGHTVDRRTTENTYLHNRIIGGTNAAIGEFPFFTDWGGCGASLIHQDILLSAAHCGAVTTNSVIIGAYYENSLAEGAELRHIVQRSYHPQYDYDTSENDVLVLKIDTPSTRTPVALNTDPNNPTVGEDLIVMGHGVTDLETQAASNTLQKVTVPYMSHAQCAANYAWFNPVVEDVMLCAGYQAGGKDSCQGDSGGPIVEKVGNTFVQVGVTSWGYGCALPNAPGVYARVSGLSSWIQGQICSMSSNPPAECTETTTTPVDPNATLDPTFSTTRAPILLSSPEPTTTATSNAPNPETTDPPLTLDPTIPPSTPNPTTAGVETEMPESSGRSLHPSRLWLSSMIVLAGVVRAFGFL